MLNLGGRRVLVGGFHDHWARTGEVNPALMLAAANRYQYDFMCLMDNTADDALAVRSAEALSAAFRFFRGEEKLFGWGHVVTVENPVPGPPADDPDFASSLRTLRAGGGLVALAHPQFPHTWEHLFLSGEVDRLLDEGCMDAVQYGRSPEEAAWYRQRYATGKPTPLIGGWDIHMVNRLPGLPPVLYQADRDPRGHIDSAGGNRTLVFAEGNTFPAVRAAVLAGQTVVEDLDTGDLTGPPGLVALLRTQGYAARVAAREQRLLAITLETDGPWVAGRPATLQFSEPGRVRIQTGLASAISRDTDADNRVILEAVPLLIDHDRTYVGVVFTAEADGVERIFAVETRHPIQLDVWPVMDRPDDRRCVVMPETPFTGELSLTVGQTTLRPRPEEPLRLPGPPAPVGDPLACRLHAREAETGATRSIDSTLHFVPVPRLSGEAWARVPVSAVDRATFSGGYGANGPYPGPAVFSARLQIGWTPELFRFRAEVTDPVHHNPYTGHMAYQGDCLQLAIDPLYRRDRSLGRVYVFNLSENARGVEVWRWKSPTLLEATGFTAPPEDVSLGDRFLRVEPRRDGRRYDLALPWSELAPARPAPGVRLGVFFLIKNSNGHGLVDSMEWPVKPDGMWTVPRIWGTLCLLP
ncbi:MAG: hypothetical protein ACFE0O_03975 [Opitutales bacterium]